MGRRHQPRKIVAGADQPSRAPWDHLALAMAAGEMWPEIVNGRRSIKLMNQVLDELGTPRNTPIEPLAATAVVERLIDRLTAEANAYSSQHAYHRLLMTLRFLPPWLYGAWELNYPTGYIERRNWIEILASQGAVKAAGAISLDKASSLQLQEPEVRALLDFVEMGRMYSSLRILLRCTSMDVPAIFPDNGVPWADMNSEAFATVEIYDQRMETFRPIYSRSQRPAGGAAGSSPDGELLNLPVVSPIESDFKGGLHVDRSGRLPVEGAAFTYTRHASDVPALLKGLDWYPAELPQLLAASFALFLEPVAESDEFDAVVRRFGIGVLPRAHAFQLLERYCEGQYAEFYLPHFPREVGKLRGAAIMSTLRSWSDPATGTRGPILINAGPEAVMIDYWALSEATQLMLANTGVGTMPNKRSRLFEQEVQRVIDDSKSAPNAELRKLVGKDVKRANKTVITDIDAIAVRGDLCILVDCKNILFQIHTRGKAAKVRNIRSNVREYFKTWAGRVAEISSIREILPPGLASAGEFIPLLVTPEPSFSDPDLLEPRDPLGLPCVVSRDELAYFLRHGVMPTRQPSRLRVTNSESVRFESRPRPKPSATPQR